MGRFYEGYNAFVLRVEVETQCSCLVKLNNFKHCVVVTCDWGEAWLRVRVFVTFLDLPSVLSTFHRDSGV